MSKKNKKSKKINKHLYFEDSPLGTAISLMCVFGFFVCTGVLAHLISVEKNQKPKQVEIKKVLVEPK